MERGVAGEQVERALRLGLERGAAAACGRGSGVVLVFNCLFALLVFFSHFLFSISVSASVSISAGGVFNFNFMLVELVGQ